MPLSGRIVTQDGIVYQVNEHRAGVIGYTKGYIFSNPVKILEYVENKPVEYIGEGAFLNCVRNIEELILPNTCLSIKKRAFRNCVCLQKVSYVNRFSNYERLFVLEEAFCGCDLLSEFIAEGSHLWVMENAFFECVNLQTISANLYVTKGRVFHNCSKIMLITVANGAWLSAKTFDNSVPEQITFLGCLRRPSKEMFKKLKKAIIVCTRDFPCLELAHEGYNLHLI